MKARWTVLLAAVLLAVSMLGISGAASALTAQETLEQPPFPPTDRSLFSPVIYDGPALVPAAEAPNAEATLRNQLKALLDRRFGVGSAKVTEALAIFDGAKAKQKVPHPRLRAALVSLKGTIGEPAISGVLDGPFISVTFEDIAITAWVVPDSNGDPMIQFKDTFQYEDLRLLAPIMAHESLHQDPSVGGQEELVADATDSLVYSELVLETPMVAISGTEMARRENTQLMARLNSRDNSGNLRPTTSVGNVYPGGKKPLANFAAAFNLDEDPNTPGNATMRQMVQNIVGPNVTVPTDAHFGTAANLLDQNQNALSDAEVVRLASILKLNVYAPTITNFSPTGSTTVQRPPIASTVSDRETNLAKTNIKLFVDGSRKTTFNYSSATDRLTFTPSSNLSFGEHTVKVVATDAQGKRAVKSWSFKVVRNR